MFVDDYWESNLPRTLYGCMLGYLCFMITMPNAMLIVSPRSWPSSSKALPLERAFLYPKSLLSSLDCIIPAKWPREKPC